MNPDTREYLLDDASIQQAVTDLDPFLERENVVGKDALRIRLTLEELLLRLRDSEQAPKSVQITTARRFGRASAVLRYGGGALDPTLSDGEEETWQSQILGNLGLAPVWGYRGGVNTVKLTLPKVGGGNQLLRMAIFVAAAVVVGGVGLLLPAGVRTAATDYMLSSLFDAFMGLLNTFAGLMIFLTVAAGVFSIGDTALLNRIGKVLLPRFILAAFISAVLTLTVTMPFMHFRSAAATQGESQMGEVMEMIFNILPRNPISPFLDGNTLQITALAAFTGVVLLILGDQARNVRALIEELGAAVRMMLELVCRLIPLFVFVSLLRQIWSGTVGMILSLWKPVLLCVLSCAVLGCLELVMTALRTKCSPVLLVRKVLPAAIVAFITDSSMASFSVGETDCVDRLGVSKKLFDFGYPVGMVIYMPAAVVDFLLISTYLAEEYAVEVNASWFLMLIILTAVLSIAVPPIPGAGVTCFGILMAQLGIPTEGMLLAVAAGIIFDFVCCGTNIFMLQLELVRQAELLHMLDREKLRRQ